MPIHGWHCLYIVSTYSYILVLPDERLSKSVLSRLEHECINIPTLINALCDYIQTTRELKSADCGLCVVNNNSTAIKIF